MNKKIIIVIAIAIILVVAGVWYLVDRSSMQDILSPTTSFLDEQSGESLSSVGWSALANEEEAAREAVAMMLEKLTVNPDLVFIYCASDYKEEKIVAEIRRLLPGTKTFGGNSGYGVITPGGYFYYPGTSQSLGVLGVASPQITWGVGSAVSAPTNEVSSREAAKQAVLAALKNAGKDMSEKPDLIINAPSFGTEHEEALKGIADAVGEEVPVFGFYAVDRAVAGDWRVFANDDVYHDGVAVTVVYTDLKIGFFREHGFEITEEGGTVTKAEKNILVEIDDRPAGDVYNELIGGLLENEMADPDSANLSKVRLTNALSPLAKVLRTPGREPFYVPAFLVRIQPDKSLVLDIAVEQGDELRVLRGDWEILLNRLRTTPEKAIDTFDIDKDKILFALNSYCCATHYVVPETERPKSYQILKEAVGDAPFIGTCACGIQNPEPLMGNVHASLGNGILMFSTE